MSPESGRRFRGKDMRTVKKLKHAPEELVDGAARLEFADALDFPFEPDARMLQHAGSHRFAEELEIVAGGAAGVDHEIAVHGGHLRAADHQAAAAGLVDLLPGRGAGR